MYDTSARSAQSENGTAAADLFYYCRGFGGRLPAAFRGQLRQECLRRDKLIHSNRLPVHKIGRRVLFSQASMERFAGNAERRKRDR
jgi:hypothetical protein